LRIYCKLKIVNCKLVNNPPVELNFLINWGINSYFKPAKLTVRSIAKEYPLLCLSC